MTQWLIYAEEADLLNIALFNCTAKDWREANAEFASESMNIRDIASINELSILSNLETINAQMIKENINHKNSIRRLPYKQQSLKNKSLIITRYYFIFIIQISLFQSPAVQRDLIELRLLDYV